MVFDVLCRTRPAMVAVATSFTACPAYERTMRSLSFVAPVIAVQRVPRQSTH